MPHYSKLNFVDIKTFRFNRLLFLYNRNIVFILSLSKRYIRLLKMKLPNFFLFSNIFLIDLNRILMQNNPTTNSLHVSKNYFYSLFNLMIMTALKVIWFKILIKYLRGQVTPTKLWVCIIDSMTSHLK